MRHRHRPGPLIEAVVERALHASEWLLHRHRDPEPRMTVGRGFDLLAGVYLGEDRELFGASVDDSIRAFAAENPEDVTTSVAGLEGLLASSMTEDELDHQWIHDLHSSYDPRDDGFTYREWFAHALQLLRSEAAKT